MEQPLPRKLVAEYLGSLLLAALVIGSGIAAQRLSPHDPGLQLTENTVRRMRDECDRNVAVAGRRAHVVHG